MSTKNVTTMNTNQVAAQLVSMCRQGKFREALEALYGANIVSVEGFDQPDGTARECRGLDAVRAKTERFLGVHDIHAVTVSEPFLALDKFAVRFDVDLTFKPTGARNKFGEIAVYTVHEGKIIREEFLTLVG